MPDKENMQAEIQMLGLLRGMQKQFEIVFGLINPETDYFVRKGLMLLRKNMAEVVDKQWDSANKYL